MKVLQVGKYYPPVEGGIEKVVSNISNGLKDKVDMSVLVANTSANKTIEKINGVKIKRVPRFGSCFSMPLVPSFPFEITRHDVNLFHFHLPFPLTVISYLLTTPSGKTVVTWHSDIVKQEKILKFYQPFLMKFLKKIDKIVTTSPNLIKNSPFLKPFKNKCEVIPLGIDPERFKLTSEIEMKADKIKKEYNKPIVFFVGRLVYYKGVKYLIKAMKQVNAQLLIGGTGSLEKKLKKMVYNYNLRNKVDFLGYIKEEDLPVYYHASDVFVLPSIAKSEAFGIVQLEAQACGKPVVSTKLPTGVPFVNKDKETGLTVEPQSSQELAKAINLLLTDKNLRMKYGQNARKRVDDKFTIERMANDYFKLYNSLK